MQKTIKKFLLIILLVPFNQAFSQDCNCESNFNWVKKTFEENDAGFKYIIEQKGIEQYANHNELYLQKAKAIQDKTECSKLLYKWLAFFRKEHLAIVPLNNNESNGLVPKIQKSNTNDRWETLKVDVQKFENYLNNKKNIDYEGIWQTSSYKIGIKKVGNNYIGFIIDAPFEIWKKGDVKLKINKEADKIKATFYVKDKSALEFNSANLLGNNYLQIGQFTLKRLSPNYPSDKSIDLSFKLLNARKPFIEELNATTLILRIPSFDGVTKEIDSVILSNKAKILTTENLIIDIRNNGGGSDDGFKEILPLIYTNPIRSIGAEFLSTKLNNQRMLDFIDDPKYGFDEEGKKWAKESFDKLNGNLGEFVNLNKDAITVVKMDEVYPIPKNVGIIINENNGSTAEEFLLAAKQSKKVKLFGTTTMGVLDISNMYFVTSPCNEFELAYSLSKSMRIPEMTLDNKGIQPDYYIDKSIEKYKWVDYVNEILNSK